AGNRAGGTSRSGAHIFRKILGIEEVTPGSRCAAAGTRENHRTLESVAEFANVAGPGVSRQHTARRIAQLRTGAGMDGANRHEKMIGERQDIGAALAQRWNRESENVEPEIKILAEAAGLHGGGKIDVGEGDQASFDAQGFRAAEAFERALLQNAEELALRCRRERGDFIENDAAVAAELEAAELALDRAGKGAAFVAEEFAFDELRRKTGTIDFQERRVTSRTEFMNQPGEMVLTGAAFTGDQKSGGRDPASIGQFKKITRCGGRHNDAATV